MVDAVEHELGGELAHVLAGVVERGQAREGIAREVGVVEGDEGEVLGDPDAIAARLMHEHEGLVVGGAYDRRRQFPVRFEELADLPVAAEGRGLAVYPDEPFFADPRADLGEEGGDPLLAKDLRTIVGAVDQPDVAMAPLPEILRGAAAGGGLVDDDAREIVAGVLGVEEHDGDALGLEIAEEVRVAALPLFLHGGDYDPVDAALPEGEQDRAFLRGVVPGLVEEEGIALSLDHLVAGRHDARENIGRDAEGDHADEHRAALGALDAECPDALAALDEPFLRKLVHRLAHRVPRHVELGHQLGFRRQLLAGDYETRFDLRAEEGLDSLVFLHSRSLVGMSPGIVRRWNTGGKDVGGDGRRHAGPLLKPERR